MRPIPSLSRNTIITGLASFLVEVSSEMIFPLLPFFLTIIIGAPVFAVALMESLGEFAAAVAYLISGLYSDKLGQRKKLVIFGYSLSAMFKAFLIVATTWPQVVFFKVVERIGKGTRESPRDALIAMSEGRDSLGAAYGFRKLMDTAGAIAGPMIATTILVFFFSNSHTNESYRLLFTVALVPAVLGVIALFFLRDKESVKKPLVVNIHYILANKEVVNFSVLMALFVLGQFSVMLFLLRANEFLPLIFIPVVYLLYNAAYAMLSVPSGIMASRFGEKKTIMFGMLLFAAAAALFAFVPSPATLFFGFLFLGWYMAISETVPQAFLMKKTEPGSYATAAGFYRAVVGVMALPANLVAGLLWGMTIAGFPAAFIFSFCVALFAFSVFYLVMNGRKEKRAV